MDSQHTAGIKLTGEAKSAVDAHRQVTDASKALAEQTARTNAVARSAAEESKRFTDRQKEQAQALVVSRGELERVTQSTLAATAAKAAFVQVARGLTGVLVGGVVGALTTAALSFVSFGAKAEEAGDQAEASAARTSRAWMSAVDAQKTQLARVRSLQNEIATLRAQGEAFDIGFGPAPNSALKGKEEELARLLTNLQHGTAPGSGGISIEEATRGLRTASTELAALERRLEAIDTAYGGEIGRVGADALMSEAQRADRIAELEVEQRLMQGAARRQYDGFIKGLGGEGESSDFDRLQKQAHNVVALSGARTEAAQELTRAQAQLASVDEAYAAGLLKNVTPAQMAQLKALYATADANERAVRSAEGARKAANESAVTFAKVNDQQIASREGLMRAAFDQQRSLEYEIGLIGKGAGEIEVANAMRQIELELRQAIAATPEITPDQVAQLRDDMEVRKRRVAVLLEERRARLGDIDGQDGRIRYALDQQRTIDEQAARSAQVFEQAVATGIMTGMRNGGGNLAKQMERIFADAIVTATLTPIATAIARPFGQIGSALAGQGGGSAAGFGVPGSGLGHFYQPGSYYEDASGNVSVSDASLNWGAIGATAVPFLGAAAQYSRADRSSDPAGEKRSASMAAAGAAIGTMFMPGIGTAIGYMAGSMLGGMLPSSGAADRSSRYIAGFGEGGNYPWMDNRWFSGSMASSQAAYQQATVTHEQNLIRNMQLTPDQIARVNAALSGPNSTRYDFGPEHTPWEQSQAFTQIRADRVSAIASALGRSVEQLTKIMVLSAEQFAAVEKQLQNQLADVTESFGGFIRALPSRLGITSLKDAQSALATSDYVSPLERVAGARDLFSSTLARARGGELEAVNSLPQVVQEALGIYRDTYASGPQFQEFFAEANSALADVLERQEGVRLDILKDVPATIMQSSKDEIAELKRQTEQLLTALEAVQTEIRSMRAEI